MRQRVSQAIHRVARRASTERQPHSDDDLRTSGDLPEIAVFAGAIAFAVAALWQLTLG